MYKKLSSILLALLLSASQSVSALSFDPANVISFSDIETLSSDEQIPDSLSIKLDKIYGTTMTKQVDPNKAIKKFQTEEGYGDVVRLAQWNVERGFNLDLIKQIFISPEKYLSENAKEKLIEKKGKTYHRVLEDIDALRAADVLVLNEADYGVSRTGYRNIAEELASTMGAGYTYVTEFIEIDPNLIDSVDENLYKGLHGTAILSKYPINNTRAFTLPDCHDWYNGELKDITLLEKTRRLASKVVFDQDLLTEVRQGNRKALFAELQLPNADQLTVVATHLEDRATPRCRDDQLKALLKEMESLDTAVVLTGDFNSTESDVTPTSVTRVYKSKISDPSFLARLASSLANPVAIIVNPALFVSNFARKFKDPTAHSIPIFFQNKARELFRDISDFEFADGGHFDFSGEDETSIKGRGAYLSNSNERWLKGFVETFQLERAYKVMRYKLDWFFVKPTGSEENKHYYPIFGRTLKRLNYSYKDYRITDHSPITVDLVVNK